jgi:hypothetical protein
LESLIGERVSNQVYGVRTANCMAVLNLMSELLGYGINYSHALLHYLGAYAVAGQDSYP